MGLVLQEKVDFEGGLGEPLSGRIARPDGGIRAWAVFAHCFTCGKDIRAARRISDGLARRGLGVLRFDFTGLGDSGGDFAATGFTSNVEDLRAAARWLGEHESPPALLVGHSLGGAASVVAARGIDSCRAVATLAAPYDLGPLRQRLDQPELRERGEARVKIGPKILRIGRQLVDDLESQSLREHLSRLGRALLVLHSPQDDTVPVEAARHLFQAARHPKSYVSLDDMDHLVSRPEDSDYVAGVIAAWSSRYLG